MFTVAVMGLHADPLQDRDWWKAMEQDARKPRPRKGGRMPSSPIKAPQGNVKGIGKMGQYTGGLDPLMVAPQPGLAPRRVAPTALAGYNIDSARRGGRGGGGGVGRRGRG